MGVILLIVLASYGRYKFLNSNSALRSTSYSVESIPYIKTLNHIRKKVKSQTLAYNTDVDYSVLVQNEDTHYVFLKPEIDKKKDKTYYYFPYRALKLLNTDKKIEIEKYACLVVGGRRIKPLSYKDGRRFYTKEMKQLIGCEKRKLKQYEVSRGCIVFFDDNKTASGEDYQFSIVETSQNRIDVVYLKNDE